MAKEFHIFKTISMLPFSIKSRVRTEYTSDGNLAIEMTPMTTTTMTTIKTLTTTVVRMLTTTLGTTPGTRRRRGVA